MEQSPGPSPAPFSRSPPPDVLLRSAWQMAGITVLVIAGAVVLRWQAASHQLYRTLLVLAAFNAVGAASLFGMWMAKRLVPSREGMNYGWGQAWRVIVLRELMSTGLGTAIGALGGWLLGWTVVTLGLVLLPVAVSGFALAATMLIWIWIRHRRLRKEDSERGRTDREPPRD